jgi:excisionase family DNA binding protein
MAELPEEFLTVAEIAELLKLNPQTVRNWIDRRELPAVRVGKRRVRVRRVDLDRFLEASSSEAEQPAGDRESDGDDPIAVLWERLGRAVADSGPALADVDRAKLVDALNAVADAASKLAEALSRPPTA